jgi:hypothetical protein
MDYVQHPLLYPEDFIGCDPTGYLNFDTETGN